MVCFGVGRAVPLVPLVPEMLDLNEGPVLSAGLGKAFAGVARAVEALVGDAMDDLKSGLVGDVTDDLKSVFVGEDMDDLNSRAEGFVVVDALSVGNLETRGMPEVLTGLVEEDG